MIAANHKVTVSLPEDLLRYADAKAQELGSSRSELIGRLLADLRKRERDALASEGYRLFAAESLEFAGASAQAVAEAIGDDGSSR